jgi:hypothetical protein
MKRIEITPGQKFNMLTILEELPIGPNGRVFKCRCDCGIVKSVGLAQFVRSLTKSCGCHRMKMRTKHGMWESREYSTWENMIQRCNNPKSRKYYLYGGRGITVCDRWLKSFKDFYEDMGSRPENTTLDRIDGEKGYYKDNCKWSNPREQLVNVRFFHQSVRYQEETLSVEAWINKLAIDRELFKSRILRGLGFKESLFNTFDIIALNVSTKQPCIYNLDHFLNITKFNKDKIIELLDTDHKTPYNGYIVRYLTGFSNWPELFS